MRRGPGSGFLRLAVLVGLGLALLGQCENARADEVDGPAVFCGYQPTWSVTGSLAVVPDRAQEAIAAAWAQVAPVARLDVQQVASGGDIRWRWLDRGVGDPTPLGTSTGVGLLDEQPYVQHAHDPSSSEDLRHAVLVDVLRDLGVAQPTSGETLSTADRATVLAQCRAETAATAPTATPATSSPQPQSGPVQQSRSVAATPAESPGSPASETAGLALVGAAILGVGAYLLLPRLHGRSTEAGV